MRSRIRRVSDLRIEPPIYVDLRLTDAAYNALSATNVITQDSIQTRPPRYTITLSGRVPQGIVEVLIGHGVEQHRGLRLADESRYPGEWPNGAGVAWYERGQWVPCPSPGCGRALVWYEAGYVPGYRVCTAGHHAQLSEDGRSTSAVRAAKAAD